MVAHGDTLNATELALKMVMMVKSTLHAFYHNFKKGQFLWPPHMEDKDTLRGRQSLKTPSPHPRGGEPRGLGRARRSPSTGVGSLPWEHHAPTPVQLPKAPTGRPASHGTAPPLHPGEGPTAGGRGWRGSSWAAPAGGGCGQPTPLCSAGEVYKDAWRPSVRCDSVE